MCYKTNIINFRLFCNCFSYFVLVDSGKIKMHWLLADFIPYCHKIWRYIRVCLNIHFCRLHTPSFVVFASNSVDEAFIWHKSPANCDAHLAESIFKHALGNDKSVFLYLWRDTVRKKFYEAALFDLDGTLIDSGEGITNSAAYSLRKFGIEIKYKREL